MVASKPANSASFPLNSNLANANAERTVIINERMVEQRLRKGYS